MPDKRLSIYNASAGSGKTFQIAKNFLTRLLQNSTPFYTSHLIGLTFTNKAANEMKKRILSILIDSSKGKMDPLILEVMKEIKPAIEKQLDKELQEEAYKQEILKRSKKRLKEILHRYDDFNLLTIDKLAYKIIHTFAREMEIPYDANIIIEPKEILDNLIDEIISELKPGEPLMENLTNIAIENIEYEKSWEIKKNFDPILRMLENENHRKGIEYIKTKSFAEIVELKKNLQKKIKEIEKTYSDFGKKGKEILKESPNELGVKTLTDNLFSPKLHNKIEFSDRLINNLSKEQLISLNTLKNKPVKEQELIKEAESKLLPLLQQALNYHEKIHETYLLYKGIFEEINSLVIIHELANKIEEFKERTHSIFISDFNPLIQKQIIKNIAEDTPYIYMRLGEKYIHYFLDEFQDTSELQWKNMIPLIKEALSKDFSKLVDEENPGTSMIVGDAKQSIYRFRNGKPEIFIDLSNEELKKGKGNPFYPVTGKKINQLKENWRSDGEIIDFNNAFFNLHKTQLKEEKYKRVYDYVEQIVPEKRQQVKEKGYIEINFLEKLSGNDEDLELPTKIHEIISDALKRGYAYEDICFLYNSHDSSIKVAEYLNEKGIPFIAEKSLKLYKSHKVNALINFIKYIGLQKSGPLFDALHFLFNFHQLPQKDQYLSKALSNTNPEAIFDLLKEAGFAIDYSLLTRLNLFDLVVYLIDKLKLNQDAYEENYIQTLLDDIFQFSKEHKTGIIGYIMHWNATKEKMDVKGADKKGAVQFMTVHASKGLEFPILIYLGKGSLFDKKKDHNEIIWIHTDKKIFDGFEILPIKLKSLEKVETYREVYNKAVSEKMFDNFNRLYVAHTRAINELYIMTEKPAKTPNEIDFKSMYSKFIYKTKGITSVESGDVFNYGSKGAKKKSKEKKQEKFTGEKINLHLWSEDKTQQKLKLRTNRFEYWQEAKKSAIEYGLQLHEIMAKITTLSNWKQNQEKYLSIIPEKDRKKIKEQIENILKHPELQEYYSSEFNILNERAILIPSDKKAFKLRRPDRILTKGNEAVVIDYKTGEKTNKHKQQINEYGNLLEEIGYQTKEKILIYLGKKIEIVRA